MFQTITAKALMRPRVAACREGGPAVAGRPRGYLSSAAQPGRPENTARGYIIVDFGETLQLHILPRSRHCASHAGEGGLLISS